MTQPRFIYGLLAIATIFCGLISPTATAADGVYLRLQL
jgi:hypothetical protein